MENNRLPDTPWHVGYTKKEDSDPRRHKACCVYFKDGKCTCRYNRCYALQCAGSAHCKHYSEKQGAMEEKRAETILALKIRDNFAQPQKRMNLKTVFYRGRKYYKISLSDKESIMIPYKPNITDEEVLSYIERYRNP